MLKSSLCHYSDVYILVRETIKMVGEGADPGARKVDEINK